MPTPNLPLVVLGGSDRKESDLPEGAELHPLAAYKGAALRIAGRPLVSHLIERLRASGGFGPLFIAGPARIYGGLVPGVEVIDTDADVASNLRAVIEAQRERQMEGPLAVMSCDVLPSVEELRDLRAEYERCSPCGVWFPLVRKPDDPEGLGAFGWKPTYGIRPSEGVEREKLLPGHLAVVDVSTLRIELLYRLMTAAYRTRNKPLNRRRIAMLRSASFGLLTQDALHLLAFRIPNLTWTVVVNGLGLARDLRSGQLTLKGLEQRIGRILLTAVHRRRHPENGVRFSVVDTLSLAEDIDTAEEAQAFGARLEEE